MPAQHDQAICIRQWDYSESSQTVVLFGRSLGCFRALAKGARRERGSFSGGIDLLTRGEAGVILKRDSELATLTEWDAHETFPRLRDDLASNRAGWYACDALGRMLPALDPHPQLFDDTLHLLRSFGSGDGVEQAMLRFQWSLLIETGWLPDLSDPDGTAATVAFDPDEARLVEDDGREALWRVRRGTLHALQAAAEGTAASDLESVRRANKLLAAHTRNVLGEEPSTMTWVFGRLPVGGRRSMARRTPGGR